MKVVLLVIAVLFFLGAADCIGGGSWSEGRRSITSNNDNFSKQIAVEFRRLKTVEEKLQYLRKICKLILKVSQDTSGFGIGKVC